MFYVFVFFVFVVIVLVIISIPMTIIGDRRMKGEIENVFGDRERLDERDFYEKYFAKKGVPFFIVRKIREILEDALDADLSRLSAEDDFSKNLSFFWEYDSLADVEILEKIEGEFEIELPESDFEESGSLTVESLVDLVWRKVREKDEFQN